MVKLPSNQHDSKVPSKQCLLLVGALAKSNCHPNPISQILCEGRDNGDLPLTQLNEINHRAPGHHHADDNEAYTVCSFLVTSYFVYDRFHLSLAKNQSLEWKKILQNLSFKSQRENKDAYLKKIM